jgi:FkbM family methyltransferase
MIWKIYQFYCFFYYIVKRILGINLKGIGVLSDFIKKPKLFTFKKAIFYFNPSCSRNYCLLPGGVPNEPETHIFLERVIKVFPKQNILFIDIGASVGEFVIPLGKLDKIKHIYAFEPNEEAAKSIMISAFINNLDDKIRVSTNPIGSYDGDAFFYLNTRSPTGSRLVAYSQQAIKVKVRKIDSIFQETVCDVIIKIDIEGGELEALKGAKEFILRNNPLIIFEYNEITKSVFKLDKVYDILPKNQWHLFRLRKDGFLDQIFDNTWNIVAVNENSIFYKICMQMIK